MLRHVVSLWTLALAGMACALLGADPGGLQAPSVVVYPLTTQGQTPAQAGGNVALLLATKLSQLGGVEVKPFTPGTTRPDFLTAAVSAGADYYVTGYLTPVGNEVSLIIQVVSVQSGSVVFSNSATVRTYADVVAQADSLKAAILHHANRGMPAVSEVAPAATSPPIATGGSVNLTKALGRHAQRESAGGSLPWGLVVNVDGDAPASDRSAAQNAFSAALHAAGLQGEILPVSAADAARNATSLCKANPGSVGLFSGTLAEQKQAVDLTITVAGCDGATVATQSSTQATSAKGGVNAAIERAAQADAVALSAAVKPLAAASPAPKT